MALIALTFTVGLLSGVVGAMTGVGGAILAVPLILSVPSLIGLPPVSVHSATGLAMVQGLVTNLVGAIIHRRAGFISGSLLCWTGPGIVIGSLVGSVSSRWLPSRWLLLLLSFVLIFCAFQMLRPTPEATDSDKFAPTFPFRFTASGLITGLLAGATGLGTGSLTIVLLIHWLKVPLRIAIGSTLAISLVAALTGTLGKALTLQVPFAEALGLGIGSMVGAVSGAKASHYVPTKTLRYVLATFITIAALHALWRYWH
ncbi:MAG: sulfite exporter TauE/SafE family protein [Candidatus Fervidibacter sp.]|uniref:sulfite exporter TauE/SafE family protein n=1 Tax=Candidatus Fervidibacter sp. TaxID=3100871 RepID=UPI00404B9C3C